MGVVGVLDDVALAGVLGRDEDNTLAAGVMGLLNDVVLLLLLLVLAFEVVPPLQLSFLRFSLFLSEGNKPL